jgi:hypothetical protein
VTGLEYFKFLNNITKAKESKENPELSKTLEGLGLVEILNKVEEFL